MAVYQVLLIFDDEAGVWVTEVPQLNGISSYGETEQEALEMTKEAIRAYLEAAEKEQLEPAKSSRVPKLVELAV